MSRTYKIAFWLLLGAMLATVYILLQRPWQALGSVETGEGYFATTTKDQLGNTVADLTVLKPSSGMLGHVVVTGAATGYAFLYDATTTNATLRTNTATTVIATLPVSLAAGTYVFDTTFNYGLLLDYTGNMATATVTWK